MDRIGSTIVRADELLWHSSNVGVGIAVLVATLVYVPAGSYSIDLVVVSIDPFYLLFPLSAAYSCWTGVGLWRWYSGSEDRRRR